jgi:predicted transposase YdaD
VPQELLDNEVTCAAVRYLERNSYTKSQLETYEKYLDAIRVERTFYVDALAKGWEEGKAEGEAIGIEKGKAEGRAEGKVEGREEGEAIGIEKGKAEVVITCRRNGIPLEQIQLVTGLDRERIEEILRADNEV